MRYEPIDAAFLKDGEPTAHSEHLLDLYDIDVFLDSFNWIEAPGPFQNPPPRGMARRQP